MRFRTALLLLLFAAACKPSQKATVTRDLPEVEVKPSDGENIYRATVTKSFDLIHTLLDVRFDWSKRYMYAKASITLHPHFYPSQLLWLNARGFTINSVQIVSAKDSVNAKYVYQNDSLGISLDKIYSSKDTLHVLIDYTAKPEELQIKSGVAVTSDKGLYFINPDGKELNKPKQIWTQGETQASSAWFPTLDAPNQKMTQQIRITVDSTFRTLSNGLMISSVNNNDGTRSDTWRQTLPHAPYLAMMTVGQFSVVKDQWRGKEVSYYVEPKYERLARRIFGNTPEMMEYFSNMLKVDYPWDKYSQVVVRDYVSGAMENTSATLHGDLLQQDERELLEGSLEDYVSHELFHQWFGDLVTAESWSNITLNESFANYAEYLWNEHKYGRDEADIFKTVDLNNYMREAKTKQVSLLRYYYENPDDVFDRHSYEKGGCILHMLRKYTGDEAFFASLNKYLTTYKFGSAEAAQLRIAFEDVTGEDLNWFFNQWYLDKGHPQLDISYKWDETSHTATVSVKQIQDEKSTRLFRLPVFIDIYTTDSVKREKVVVEGKISTFKFTSDKQPALINFDAEKSTLCQKIDHHTTAEFKYMYDHAPLFNDRLEALRGISNSYNGDAGDKEYMVKGLTDRNWKIRQAAISYLAPLYKTKDSTEVKLKLVNLAGKDPKAVVRNEALEALGDHFLQPELINVFRAATTDSSYVVLTTGLELTTRVDSSAGLSIARTLEKESYPAVMEAVSSLYAAAGNENNLSYMLKAFNIGLADEESRYGVAVNLAAYSLRINDQKGIEECMKRLFDSADNSQPWHYRLIVYKSFLLMQKSYEKKKSSAAQSDKSRYEYYLGLVNDYIKRMKESEKDENLLKIYAKDNP